MLGVFILIYLLSIFYLPRFAFILTVFMLYGFIKNKNYILSQILLCIWIISPFIYEFALTSKMNFFTNVIETITTKLYIYKLVSIGEIPQIDWGCYLTIAIVLSLINVSICHVSSFMKKHIKNNKKIIKSIRRG
ncbi:hypothetical protein B2H86_15015 [Clostridium botulinum]|uniref:hypothetical protein n=1 Tax=Clostridium botulinum TaxID=1491 RepID=UPI0004710821|nr:hypothetical protein [Clostridium botulinum]OSA73653.1 hypothetical protein B2H86_15015 [Clostridium botulinum]